MSSSSSSSSSSSEKQKKVAIIGAGPVGAMAALALAKRGYKVDVFEKRPDSRSNKVYEGRSINLALSQRGRTALRKFGLEDEMVNSGVEMKSRLIHTISGATYSVPYGPNGEAILSISRQGINELLVTAAEAQENVTFQFNTGCEEVNLQRREIVLSVETPSTSSSDSGDEKKKPSPSTFETKIYNDYDFIIGSDGARSAARKALVDRHGYDYSQKYLDHDYKELTIPANADGSYKLSPHNALHIWPRGDFMMIGLPNQDGSFTMTLFMPHKNFEAINTDDEITSFFNTNFPDAVPLMPTLLEDYKRNRTGRLCTINLFPWHYSDFLVIMGDAAHAVVPFYGQGMNASLEDVNVFDSLFDQFGDQNIASVLEHFSVVRPKDADAIGFLSQQNYLEMRSHVTSPLFLIRSQVEKFICRNPFLRNSLCLGYSFLPKYSMVAFSNIPYAEVIRRDREQTERLDLILYRLFPLSVLSLSLGLFFVPPVRNQISSLVSKTLSLLSIPKK